MMGMMRICTRRLLYISGQHRRRLVFVSGIVFVFLLAIMARSRQTTFFFLSDDFTLIDAVAQRGPFGIWSSQGAPFFRPLISLSLFLNYQLGGLNPTGYYVTNLLLHAMNACLVTWITALLFADSQHPHRPLQGMMWVAAVMAGASFAITPTLGESVIWISARTDLIASFFGLLAFALFICWRHARRVVLMAAALVCLVLGLLSKESVITLPIVLLGYEAFRQKNIGSRDIEALVRGSLAAVLMLGAYLVVRWSIIGALIGGYGAAMHLNIRSIPASVAQAFGHMFVMGPLRLSVTVTALIVILCLLAVAVRWWHDPAPQFGVYALPFVVATLALIAFLPATTYPVGPFVPSGFGFRTLYLPAAFGFIALAILIRLAVQHTAVLMLIGVLAVGAYTWSLSNAYAYWSEASRISVAFVDGLRQLPAAQNPEIVLVLNVPERTQVGGVHIFRNGLESAGHLFSDQTGQRTFVRISRQEIAEISDKVRVEHSGTTYTLQFAGGRSRFITQFDPFAPTPTETPWYSLSLMAEDSLVMQIKPPSIPSVSIRVLAFSSGRLYDVSDTQQAVVP